MRLLLVDDSPQIRKQLPRLLGGVPGIREVDVASDGDSGLYMARERDPEVMIVDLELRGSSLNGIELITELAARERIPTLMVYTNHPELREYALQAGADYFFDKGTETGRLLETLRRIAPTERPSQNI
jgi:DNA-binding NarL/FixJ family response regulator